MPLASRSIRNAALLTGALMMSPTLQAASALELVATIELPGVKGRIDHLSADVKGHRIFVAALGNDSVEIVDTRGGAPRSLAGFGEPQGVAYLPDSNRFFVANGSADRVDVVDAATMKVVKRIDGLSDADNVRHDPAARRIFVGHGRGALAILDADTGAKIADIALPGHPESFQLQRHGPRIFVNVPGAQAIVVVDRDRRATLATWGTGAARANFPMALDEESHRLFVGFRTPATLRAYDTETGKPVAEMAIGGDTDDVFHDRERKRLYAVCGEGRIDVIAQEAPDRYVLRESIPTAPGARTGLFVPEEGRLYVAAPARGGSPARVLVFRVP